MLHSFYDIIIIGADLPSLIYGALCAKKGFRVLLVGNSSVSNNYWIDGMPMVRIRNLFWGLNSSVVIGETFKELILRSEMRTLPELLSPSAQVILPEKRIELTTLKGIFEQELRREFPDSSLDIFEFYNLIRQLNGHISAVVTPELALPPSSLREYYNYYKKTKPLKPLLSGKAEFELLKGFAERKQFTSFLFAPLSFMSGIRYETISVIPFVKLIDGLMKGFFRIDSGIDTLKSIFIGKIRSNSGDCYLNESAEGIDFRRGGTMEVEIRGREGVYGCRMLVCGMEVRKFLDLIPPGKEKRRFHEKIIERKPSHYEILINVVVNRKVIPEGMANYAFMVFDPEKPLEDENLLMVCIDNASENNFNKNRAVLTVSSHLRADSKYLATKNLIDYFTKVFEIIEKYIPFFSNEMITYDSPALRYDERGKRWEVDESGLQPIYSGVARHTMGLTGLTIRTAYKNILYLGSEAFSGLGFEGAFLAALMAVNITEKKLKLKR